MQLQTPQRTHRRLGSNASRLVPRMPPLTPLETEQYFEFVCKSDDLPVQFELSDDKIVSNVSVGGPAHMAGVQPGMQLVDFGGVNVEELSRVEVMEYMSQTLGTWRMRFRLKV